MAECGSAFVIFTLASQLVKEKCDIKHHKTGISICLFLFYFLYFVFYIGAMLVISFCSASLMFLLNDSKDNLESCLNLEHCLQYKILKTGTLRSVVKFITDSSIFKCQ